MSRGRAFAKINLALVVGPRRADGKHEVVTVLQRIDLHDEIEVEPADALVVDGFAEDTIVREALLALADAAGVAPRWRVRIDEADPGRRRTRRWEQRRRDRLAARQRGSR